MWYSANCSHPAKITLATSWAVHIENICSKMSRGISKIEVGPVLAEIIADLSFFLDVLEESLLGDVWDTKMTFDTFYLKILSKFN